MCSQFPTDLDEYFNNAVARFQKLYERHRDASKHDDTWRSQHVGAMYDVLMGKSAEVHSRRAWSLGMLDAGLLRETESIPVPSCSAAAFVLLRNIVGRQSDQIGLYRQQVSAHSRLTPKHKKRFVHTLCVRARAYMCV